MTLDDFIQALATPMQPRRRHRVIGFVAYKTCRWDKAHEIVQSLETHDAAWVHASASR